LLCAVLDSTGIPITGVDDYAVTIEYSATSASYSASMLDIAASTIASSLAAFIFCQLFSESVNELGLRFYITERKSNAFRPRYGK
jgi:hypothetical protein